MGRDPDVFHARLGTSVEYDMVWFSVVIFTIWRIVENAVSSPSWLAMATTSAPGAYDNYAVPSISFLEAWQEPSSLVPTGVLPTISNW